MKLIVGLGNPGKQYEKTWHNLGFLTVEKFRQERDLSPWKKNSKFKAELTAGQVNKEKIILARPLTFMNNSGWAVKALMKYYKIKPEDLVIIHDDIDLPLGKLRLAKNSSSGGHNGIKSIIDELSTKDFIRIKIGIQTDKTKLVGAPDYVLEKFSRAQEKEINLLIKKAASAIETVVVQGLEKAMSEYN